MKKGTAEHPLSEQSAATRVANEKSVYWHRELPPRDAEAIGEHVVEATSRRVRGSLDHGSEQWERCYQDLTNRTLARLEQEIARLGGDYAHILNEHVDTRRDDSRGESWLHGEFTYVLYRRPSA